jgi:hypothetical protein
MKRPRQLRWQRLAVAALCATVLASSGFAQDPDDQSRGVARISVINGEVSVRRGDSGDWVAAVINAPLMADDYILTGPNSRAEVQFDSANILRIGGSAEVRITQLEYSRYQMDIARGTVTYRVLRPSSVNVEVDTPNISVRPNKQGVYRIFVNDAGETQLIVRAGEVEVFTPRGSQWVSSGQMMMARGGASDPEFQIVSAHLPDEWDQWNDTRDRSLLQSASYQHVGSGVYGVEDLDSHGNWVDVAPYGYVWHPRTVAADWAPYSYGRWAWQDWYGWTWISYDPWGWAPYHYGRWFWETRYGWCWYPGLRHARHYWSPALVAWFGFGGRSGVGFGFGRVGWVPLAPYEVFHPWWGRGYYGRHGFDRNINITNINITNVYRNSRVRNGISGMSADDFRSGRFRGISRYSGDQVREAGLVRGQMPFRPSDAHVRFSDRSVANVPRTAENRRFYRQQQPNPVQRIPFAQQRAGDQSGRGGDLGNRGGNVGSRAGGGDPGNRGSDVGNRAGAADFANRGRDVGNRGAADSGNRGGNPAARETRGGMPTQGNMRAQTGEASPQVRNDRPSGSSGWRRFGEPGRTGGSVRDNEPRSDGNNALRGARPESRVGGALQPQSRVENDRPANRGGWQRFGDPSRPSAPSRRTEAQDSVGAMPRSYSGPRSEPRSVAPGSNSPREWSSPGNTRRETPRIESPRGFDTPGSPRNESPRNNAPRSYTPPSSPRSSAPSYNSPRSYSPPSNPRSSAPSYNSPRSYSSPRSSAPSSPRNYGGGGARPSAPSYSAPRSQSPSYSGPRSSGGSSPRSFGGGGSSPRSFGGGSAPRGSGGGGRPSGGGGGRGRGR